MLKLSYLYILLLLLLVFVFVKKKPIKHKYSFDFYVSKINKNDRKDFVSNLHLICNRLGINPLDLLAVMYSESGLRPNVINDSTNAVGLIQFMPGTAKALNTSTLELSRMRASEQLFYVYLYLKQFKGKLRNAFDIYTAIFFPRALNKSPNYVFETQGLSAKTIAKANKGIDLNKDGKITKREFLKFVKKRIYR